MTVAAARPDVATMLSNKEAQLRNEKAQLLEQKLVLQKEKLVLLTAKHANPGQSSQSIPGTQEQLVFWKNLWKAKVKSEDVSINQAEDMEVDEIPGNQDPDMEVGKTPEIKVKVTILELQDNSKFMGFPEGMSSIMVPKFYNDLWEKAERLIDENTGKKGMVITGTPGTGKSVMGWYFIYKLRMKLGSFDLVYQNQRSAMQTLYSKDGTVTSAETAAGSFRRVLSRKYTVYVVDGAGVLNENAMTFVFASPHPRNYNESERTWHCIVLLEGLEQD